MIGYATVTGTKRNMAALKQHGWHVLITPDTHAGGMTPKGLPFAIDNGAWGAYQKAVEWNAGAFTELLDIYGATALWVVLPDIVGGGAKSLALSLSWVSRIKAPRLRLIAAQDGMKPSHLHPHLGPDVGIFLGGTTEWKLHTMRAWGALARDTGCYFHVGRVNSMRRIFQCQDAGADSFDGTSCTRFAKNTPKLTAALNQGHLFGGMP